MEASAGTASVISRPRARLLEQRAMRTGIDDGVKALELAEAAARSVASGRAVAVTELS